MMGAWSKWVPARIAEYCDGWMPIDGMADIETSLREIKAALKDAGRAGDDFDVTMLAAASPDRDPDFGHLEACIKVGVNRILLPVPNEKRDGTLAVLDSYAGILERLG